MTKDEEMEKLTKLTGLDFEALDKEYDQLQKLVLQFDPTRVMMLLSTCLIHHSRCRGIDPGTLLGALCEIWNITRDEETEGFIGVAKAKAAAVMDTDGKLH
jgi:hypothetical protein